MFKLVSQDESWGIDMGEPAVPADRINCARGSVELKKCRSRVGQGEGEAGKMGWNQKLKGCEHQAKEVGLLPVGSGHH